MAITIEATAGHASANSFVTEAAAIAYLETRLNLSGWTTISGTTCTDNEKRALIEATRELTALAWAGKRVNSTQALSWPRDYAVNPDTPDLAYFGTAVIPQRVRNATCELALEFLKAGSSDIAALDPTISVIRKRVDVLETEYAAPYMRPQGLARFPRVAALVAPLLDLAAVGGLDLVRT